MVIGGFSVFILLLTYLCLSAFSPYFLIIFVENYISTPFHVDQKG
jgi:hypothetical protein